MGMGDPTLNQRQAEYIEAVLHSLGFEAMVVKEDGTRNFGVQVDCGPDVRTWIMRIQEWEAMKDKVFQAAFIKAYGG